MTVQQPPIFLQSEDHPAEDIRRFIGAITGDAAGVLFTDDMVVSEQGSPGMGVTVAGGRALILGDEATYQGTYFVENRGDEDIVVAAADATNPRIDRVVAIIEDEDYSGSTNAWSLAVVEGTPAGSPSAPAAPDNAITLALIDVAANVTSIVNADISDERDVVVNDDFAPTTISAIVDETNIAGTSPAQPSSTTSLLTIPAGWTTYLATCTLTIGELDIPDGATFVQVALNDTAGTSTPYFDTGPLAVTSEDAFTFTFSVELTRAAAGTILGHLVWTSGASENLIDTQIAVVCHRLT